VGRGIVEITPELIGRIAMIRGNKNYTVISDVPEDAKYVGTIYDKSRDVFKIIFESEKFSGNHNGKVCHVEWREDAK